MPLPVRLHRQGLFSLLGKICAVDVLFQRLVDERRDHEAERHVDEHVAAVVDCGIEIRIRKRGVKELRRLIDLVDRDAADEMDDEAADAAKHRADIDAALLPVEEACHAQHAERQQIVQQHRRRAPGIRAVEQQLQKAIGK